jgi:fused signal recognition particle receptor
VANQLKVEVKKEIKEKGIRDFDEVKKVLIQKIRDILLKNNCQIEKITPKIILIIGINGTGKTTSTAKLANFYKSKNKSVMLAAADTFRAAAIDQLEIWAKKININIIKHKEGSDPGAVVYDAIKSSKSKNIDVLICDTAGRMHNKKNLNNELAKIFKIIKSEYDDNQIQVLISIDVTTGQNSIQQIKTFAESVKIDGIILTKLDSSSKGGAIITIQKELEIPIKFTGVGETLNDLEEFDVEDFLESLF